MFKISPVADEQTKLALCQALEISCRPGAFLYAMTDSGSGELLGGCQFDIFDGYGYIYDLTERAGRSDFEAMFILGRSTMNFIDKCGAHYCRADKNAAPERLLRAIGLSKENDLTVGTDMSGMFDGKCTGRPVDLSDEPLF